MKNNQNVKNVIFILCISLLLSTVISPATAEDNDLYADSRNHSLGSESAGAIATPETDRIPITAEDTSVSLMSTSVTSNDSVHDFTELLSVPTSDGCIYSFKNSATNKYVSSTNDSNYANTNFNIYQHSTNTTPAQAFRLEDAGNGCFYIIPLELGQTESHAMYADMYYIENRAATSANVSYATYAGNTAYEFRWIIECYERTNDNSDFIIKIYEEDPDYDYLLTPFTEDDGYPAYDATEGLLSVGNIGINRVESTSDLNPIYLWQMESGGRQLHYGINLRSLETHFDICKDTLNTPYINCPVMNYGETCSIGTSVNHVISINTSSFRVNTSLNPGYSTIMALMRGNDGSYGEIVQKVVYVYFTPGIHYISDTTDSYVVTSKSSNPAQLTSYDGNEPREDAKLFELLYVGNGKYCVLTKADRAWAMGVSGSNLVAVGVGTLGDYSFVSASCKWTIESTANGYYIYNGSVSLKAPSPIVSGSTVAVTSGTRQYWNIQRAYFLSGYELPYNTSAWNDPDTQDDDNVHIQYYTNCYGYAFNNQTLCGIDVIGIDSMEHSYTLNMQPGLLGGVFNEFLFYYPAWLILSPSDLKELLGLDAQATTGMTLVKTTKNAVCPTGTYKVALVYNPNTLDYHWYRQDSDGTWSHKPGKSPVTKLDDAGNPIIDPQYAATSYSTFVGYYYVKSFDILQNNNEIIVDQFDPNHFKKYYPSDFQ